MLPDRPTEHIINYYIRSGVFWTDRWKDSCEIWWQLQKKLVQLDIDSVCQVGIGPTLQGGLWNDLLYSMLNVRNFVNVDIVEKFVETAKEQQNIRTNNAYLCDVREIDELFEEDSFDLTMWSHGPEHIVREEWDDTFRRLEKVTKKVIILQCPWGTGYDYDHEHLSKNVQEDEFEPWGFEVATCGSKNTKDCGILAWKILTK